DAYVFAAQRRLQQGDESALRQPGLRLAAAVSHYDALPVPAAGGLSADAGAAGVHRSVQYPRGRPASAAARRRPGGAAAAVKRTALAPIVSIIDIPHSVAFGGTAHGETAGGC